MQNIPTSHACSLDERKYKGITADKNLPQVYYTDKSESESVIINESSTEDSKSESVHKSINTNKGKDAINKTEDEKQSVPYNPVINEPRYFNLFKFGKKS